MIDDDTIIYNIHILKEYQLAKNSLIKVLHMKKHRIIMIMTDSNLVDQSSVNNQSVEEEPNQHLEETGFDIVFKIMRNFFQFKLIHSLNGESSSKQCESSIINLSDEEDDPFSQ